MLQFVLALCTVCVLASDFTKVDRAIHEALREEVLPGGALVVGSRGEILKDEAYGRNAPITLYDIASLSKVVGTATAIMILEDEGKLSIHQKLSDLYPEFKTAEKKDVTILHLLRHNSGLPSSIKAIPGESYSLFIKRALSLPLAHKTNIDTVYSDTGFIILGDIVQKVSGRSLHDFTQEKIFVPLKMKRTGYIVKEQDLPYCAPTSEKRPCVPHDPKAFAHYPSQLGHAGLFSDAKDLTTFVRMYLNGGELDGVRILKEETIHRMTKISGTELRGLGWDLLSPYATAPRGDVFPAGESYGHTGFTGTTIWIDPVSESFYVFLSNRVFLGEDRTGKPFTKFRNVLSTLIGEAIYSTSSTEEIPQ